MNQDWRCFGAGLAVWLAIVTPPGAVRHVQQPLQQLAPISPGSPQFTPHDLAPFTPAAPAQMPSQEFVPSQQRLAPHAAPATAPETPHPLPSHG